MELIDSRILFSFFKNDDILGINKYGNGHINDTYLVTTISGKYIIQKVNGDVFNVENLTHNYTYLNKAAADQGGKWLFPEFITNEIGAIHSIDSMGHAWRVNRFISDCPNFGSSPNIIITEQAGIAMGRFQLFLAELNPDLFKDTITDFHNPQRRISDFDKVIKSADSKRLIMAKPDIQFAIENRSIAEQITTLLNSNTLPVRITHNDTKLDNILFDLKNDRTYVIDLDTVMKGSILFDFGDMVRSITSLAKEDEKNLSNVTFSLPHFEALCKGYLGEIKNTISKVESDSLLSGIQCIIYIQGVRFLTDHLAGNIYYNTDYDTHNLDRSRTQFKLLDEILKKKNETAEIIRSVL